ncbi:hypothetical protein SAMN05442782_0996 [Streptomyces sp. OK228]|nr:hypothetical protein SAMN05442782_0996 [Streptomyces sp. OK228]
MKIALDPYMFRAHTRARPTVPRRSEDRRGTVGVEGTWMPTGRGRRDQTAGAGKVGYSTPETCWTTRTTWQE